MKCPRDDSKLNINSREGIVGYCCDECNGIFLKGSYMKAFKINFKTKVLEYRFKIPTNTESDLLCSHCNRQMLTSYIDDIEIDICKHCQGVWFDKSEVKDIIKQYDSNIPKTKDEGVGSIWGVYSLFEISFWLILFILSLV